MAKNHGFIYLAQPYSTNDPEVMAYRVEQAFKATAKLMGEGWRVFSPIVHTHELGKFVSPETAAKHDFWMEQDIALLRHAAHMVILDLPGWKESKGVAQEITVAELCQIPITFMGAI